MFEGVRRLRRYWRLRQARVWLRRAERAVARFPAVRTRRPSPLPGPLIVSLTSYPPRFASLHLTLKSLLDQDIAADRTILWIAEADLGALPESVRALERFGLEIRGCADLLSYKKLIPCLAAFPDAFVVTADDDAYYPPGWLARLVAGYRAGDPAVIAGRAHLARFAGDGLALPYADWRFDTQRTTAGEPRTAIFPTGAGGILYPPRCFAPEVMDERTFLELCAHGDDIWFFTMQRRAGTGQRRAKGSSRLVVWDASQESALWLDNIEAGRNDRQIAGVEARFGGMAG